MNIMEYKDLWKQELNNGNENCVYIDIPFCKKICKYCIYHSSIYSAERVKSYLENSMYKWIDIYNQVFDTNIPDSIYFGGGTASILSIGQLENIFRRMNFFEKIKYKSFEGSIDTMHEDKISYLLDMGFRYFSVGIQSFNENTIIDENRIYVSPKQIKKTVEQINNYKNATLSVDLIAFLKGLDSKSLLDFRKDLIIMCSEIKPDIICIHPKYQQFDLKSKEYYKWLVSMISIIVDVMNDYDYVVTDSNKFFYQNYMLNSKLVEEWGLCAHNIYKKENVKLSLNNKKYNCSNEPNSNKNVFAMGGYGERMLYSYIGKKCSWKIKDDDGTICILDI